MASGAELRGWYPDELVVRPLTHRSEVGEEGTTGEVPWQAYCGRPLDPGQRLLRQLSDLGPGGFRAWQISERWLEWSISWGGLEWLE